MSIEVAEVGRGHLVISLRQVWKSLMGSGMISLRCGCVIANKNQELAYCLLGWIMATAYNLLGRMMACWGVLLAEFQKLGSSITQLKTCGRGEGASYGCASIVNLCSENHKS